MKEQAQGMEMYIKALTARMKDMNIDINTSISMNFGKAIEALKAGSAIRRVIVIAMHKIKNIINYIIAITVVFSVVAFIIYGIVQCSNERDDLYNYKIKYGIEHPMYYEISFVNGHKDTITVWTDPEYGDYIEMYDNGGVFTKGNIVLRYVPYKKYTRSDFLWKINLYNVLYYNKLKMRRY